MSRSQFFTYFLLGSLLTACGRADRIVTHIIKDNDLRHNCAFELNGHGYNLCPLVEERVVVEGSGVAKSYDEDKGEGSSSGGRFYEVTLGGLDAYSFSTRVTSGLEGSGCGEDTWVCMLDVEDTDRWDIIAGNIKSTRKTPRASSIARKARRSRKSSALKTTISLNIQKENNDADHRPLHLSLYGGMLEKQRQSAEIVFICSDEETLKYVREDKGVHFFSWTTSHGCPTKLTSTIHPDIVAANEPNSGSEEPAPGDKQGDDDLMPLDNSRARRWIAIIVVVLVGLVFGCILLSSSRARSLATENLKGATYTILPLLSQAFTKLRPIGNSIHRTTNSIVRVGSRFRQGDSKLVRWAQEDMSLLDSEDVMVNGSGAMGREDDWNVNGMEEYIPLANNPQHGRRVVRSYGATPDVETFAERGAMSGLAKYFHR